MPRIATRPPATMPWRRANSTMTASSAAAIVRSARSENALPARARVDRAGQQAHADQELLLGREDAQPVEHFLVRGRALQEGGQPRRQIGAVGKLGQERSDRAARRRHAGRRVMIWASRGAAPMIVAISLSSAGIGLQQREELDAGRQAGQEGVEAHERVVGALGAAERRQQRRRQFGQPLARLGRLRRLVAPEMPGADDAGDVARRA